jgi:hypothetical protein
LQEEVRSCGGALSCCYSCLVFLVF